MVSRWSFCRTACAVFGLAAASAQTVRYDIVMDAGSTGTRMYLFTSNFSGGQDGEEKLSISTKKIGKKKPGLSAYATNPDGAAPPLLELFKKVQGEIPKALWADTTVSILGTAGMRSLEPAQVRPIYDAVRKGLVSSPHYIFDRADKLQLRSLSGTEEGTFSLLCVNFLTGRLDHRLQLTEKGKAEKLLGILDLGGSSTQIAVPPAQEQDDLTTTAVRSYPAYGMEQMRGRLDALAVERGLSSSPCYFRGYKDPVQALGGSGNANECRKMLLEVFERSAQECVAREKEDIECIPGGDAAAAMAGSQGMQFYAVSGYLYVTDFAAHWLSRSGNSNSGVASMMQAAGNKPTIAELLKGADELCASDWKEIETAHAGGAETGAHRYTDSVKAPHRCLEINYVVTLLGKAYGFPNDDRLVTFEDEVDENDVEWPLGALLSAQHQAAQISQGKTEL